MVAIANQLLMTDGDAAFLRVDNRRPSHALEPGVVAHASNIRFENGKPGPRHGVARDGWGLPHANVIPVGATHGSQHQAHVYYEVTLEVGKTYIYTQGNTEGIGPGNVSPQVPTDVTLSGRFVATQATYWIWGLDADVQGAEITATLFESHNTCAYKRFDDPGTDTDNTILITDEWRTSGDGGKGRAWRIIPGNGPLEIDLNGHDVWDTARLIQCDNAMVLLRHGDERHYFLAADTSAAADTITLHCSPSWAAGSGNAKRCRFVHVGAEAFLGDATVPSTCPANGNYYYAKLTGTVTIELYSDAGCTNKMTWLSVETGGKFYLELAETPAPWYGNAAPPLILQPGVNTNAFENGFVAVPDNAAITDTDAASDVITAENHRLQPGDSVAVTLSTDAPGTKYCAPRSLHTFVLYSTAAEALLDSGTKFNLTVDNQTGSVSKTSAAGVPMPGGREGVYYKGRLIIVNGRDNVLISDPYDFLHFTVFSQSVAANLGESGPVNWLMPLGEDTLLVGKVHAVLAISGLSLDFSAWKMEDVTREYGGIAPLAALNVGSDVWCMSRKGVASITRTVAGERLGVARTVSHPIPQYLLDLDWGNMDIACAETWNNRCYIGVPLKEQDDTANPVNNRVLVHNSLNQFLRVNQDTSTGDVVGGVTEMDANITESWEGAWSGDLLKPYAFARLTVNGEERLTFATADGMVCWLHDGWDDAGAEIQSELLTRGYFGGREVLALKGKINWDSFRPLVTASIVSAGVNEEDTLAGFDELEYDRTQYLVDGQTDYDPATSTTEQFDAPHREDYSPTAEELTVATLDQHQNVTEPYCVRERCTAPQLRIINTQGSLRVCSISMQAKPVGVAATRKS